MVYRMWMLKWAQSKKRITNKMIRDKFDVDESEADAIYNFFKKSGVVGKMGYVNKDIDIQALSWKYI